MICFKALRSESSLGKNISIRLVHMPVKLMNGQRIHGGTGSTMVVAQVSEAAIIAASRLRPANQEYQQENPRVIKEAPYIM